MGKGSKTLRRGLLALVSTGAAVLLSGCSSETMAQWTRWGLPEAASDRAPHIGNLWNGAWIASMVIGVFVWGLMGWVVFRYRRKHVDEIPRQNRYNLPLEILYTIVPLLIIGVLFFFTVKSQDAVAAQTPGGAKHTVNIVAQKWSWTFNYLEKNNAAVGEDVHDVGTLERIPDLYLPLGESVRFNVDSADVNHSFWIPEFYFKVDAIPGHHNHFEVTPTRAGTFLGKCAELCGTYHSAMLFRVHVVSPDEYHAKLKELVANGQTGEIKVPEFSLEGPAYGEKKEG